MESREKPKFIAKKDRKQRVVNKQHQKTKSVVDANGTGTIRMLKNETLSRPKPERRKRSSRFVFDWDESENTLKDENHLNFIRAKRVRDETDLSEAAHWSSKEKHEMTSRDWRIFKEDYHISVKGGSCVNPIRFWEESDLNDRILRVLTESSYFEPTPIQRQAIPAISEGYDMIGVAKTGSGKTAAFLLPIINMICKLPARDIDDGPYALILVPTRELAQQIENEALKFCESCSLSCISVVGGHSHAEQTLRLQSAEIIIATPGRLRDCIENHFVVVRNCKYVVLDEADRMVDLNYEEDLHFILSSLPKVFDVDNRSDEKHELHKFDLQVTMFSATMPSEVEKLIQKYLREPVAISIGDSNEAVDSVIQEVKLSKESDKEFLLIETLRRCRRPPIIVFVNQKIQADHLGKVLKKYGFKYAVLHGGKTQEQRESALKEVIQGEKDILLATDVVGRGIDIPQVQLVINYDMPKSIQAYTHRIGRTGRAGETGKALTFLTEKDADLFLPLKELLMKSPISECPDELFHHPAAKRDREHKFQ